MKMLTCLVALVWMTATASAQDANALVQKVKARLDQVNDYRAEGTMKIDVSFIDASPSKVTIYYKKPDKFKVKKENGISLLPRGGVSINLGTLLAGGQYDIVPSKDAKIDGVTLKVVKLLPTDDNSDLILTTLYIDEKNLVIRKATVATKASGQYDILFTYGRYASLGLPDKVVFSFDTKDYKLPKGITFEYEKGGPKKEENKNTKGSVEITYSSYTINKGVDDKIFQGN